MEAYPQAFIFFVLATGIGLALFNGNRAFLFVVFCVSALNMSAAFKTRTILGPYFNLVDALVLVMLVALIFHAWKRREPVCFPKLFIAILVTWCIGTLMGLWTLGWQYEVIRSARWALNFPIAIFVSANFIKEEYVRKKLLNILFWGAVVAALQHILEFAILSRVPGNLAVASFRNIGFLTSPISYFLVVSTQGSLSKPTKIPAAFWVFCIGLFTTSLILSQTRSTWLSVLLAPFLLAILFQQVKILGRFFLVLLPITFVVYLISQTLPAFDPIEIISQRYQLSFDETHRRLTIESRELAARIETQAWLEGNLLFGRGLAYNWDERLRLPYGVSSTEIAWSHIGYIAYLAQLGLVGLLVYGVMVPISSLRHGYQLVWSDDTDLELRKIALLALGCFVINLSLFAMSGSYLQSEMLVPGLLVGAVLTDSVIQPKPQRFRKSNFSRKSYGRYAPNHHRNAIL